MANAKIPGPLGMYSTNIDAGTLARTSMPQPGVVGSEKIALHTDVEQAKRALAMDIGQLILDITGIIDPTPISDGANFLISLARRNWVDAVASAVSIVPYIGDLAKTAKLPRYIKSVRKAIDVAKFDLKWASALRELFAKLKKVLDECSNLAGDLLPDAAKKQLKELKDEVDIFLSMKGGTTGTTSGSGRKTGRQSTNTSKSQGKGNRPKHSGKFDNKPEKEYAPGKDNGPKTTNDPDKKPDKPPNIDPLLDSQRKTQAENVKLISDLKKANPDLSNKEIADLAKQRLKVPEAPHGYTMEKWKDSQKLIKKFLKDNGIKDAEGFATGSRVTGTTLNPKKPSFGETIDDFSKKDLDITLVTKQKITKGQLAKLKKLYQAEFKHPLGVRSVVDKRQLDYIPVYGSTKLGL